MIIKPTGTSLSKRLYENYSARTYEENSKAVLASDGYDGIVLFTVGFSLKHEMQETGVRSLSDLGLDDAPIGISVWEGKYLWTPGGYECPQDGSTHPVGKFRVPSKKEWKAIQKNVCPWDEKDYFNQEDDLDSVPWDTETVSYNTRNIK